MGFIENVEDRIIIDNVKKFVESFGDGNKERSVDDVEKLEEGNGVILEMVVLIFIFFGEDFEERSSGIFDYEDFICECDFSDVEIEGMRDRLYILIVENVGQFEYEKEVKNEKEVGSIKIVFEIEKIFVLV